MLRLHKSNVIDSIALSLSYGILFLESKKAPYHRKINPILQIMIQLQEIERANEYGIEVAISFVEVLHSIN